MRVPRLSPAAWICVLAVAPILLRAQSAPVNSSVELRAKEIDRRLAAIDAVAASGQKDAETLLQPLLRDKDWEIQEHTAAALGRMQSRSSMSKLVELAVDGDIVRVRRAAALAVAAIDAADGSARLFKLAKGRTAALALEALAITLRGQPGFADADKLEKLIADPDRAIREAAAAAWLEGARDRTAALERLLQNDSLIVRCRVLDTVAEAPRIEDLNPLVALLRGPGLQEVVGRRLVQALAAVLAASGGDRAAPARIVLQQAGDGDLPALRAARLLPLLVRCQPPVLEPPDAVQALRPRLQAPSARARAAAARALREVGGPEALALALQHFPNEPDPQVQYQLVETVTALRPPSTPEAVEWLTRIVTGNYDTDVRERAIVRLGRSGTQGATDALVGALNDRHWQIGVCAAVSLGKTDDDRALGPLLELFKHPNWKLRGAAIVGLMHWSREPAVDPLLAMLDDQHPVVARAAHEALRTMSRQFDAKPDAKAWRAFWQKHRATHDFTDREASLDRLKRYGYAVPDTEVYSGLDVIVFKSRGDHIEQLLDRLEIGYRSTEAGKVLDVGVHPEAIFVSNCTGELAPQDVEPLAWFVRAGGFVFGSCWALSHTIARLHPGVVQRAPTRDQVLDDVRALPCRASSPLLTGVFPPSVVPIYHLEGAHLIQVDDPERCEVLIDSPEAAERWGNGNLAAWFSSGHGVLFVSANHFDLQGLAAANRLRTDKDRQAYAVDHMGMSYARLREVRGEAYWKSATKAKENVPDLSAFRLLTNFVRSKRSGEL